MKKSVSVTKDIRDRWISRFHPTKPVLACTLWNPNEVILFKAANGFVPFSNWRERKMQIKTQDGKKLKPIRALEWNVNQTIFKLYRISSGYKFPCILQVNGTQLASCSEDGVVIVWNYFSNNILVQNNHNLKRVVQIEWNPFRQDMLATLLTVSKSRVFLSIIKGQTIHIMEWITNGIHNNLFPSLAWILSIEKKSLYGTYPQETKKSKCFSNLSAMKRSRAYSGSPRTESPYKKMMA